MNMRRPAIQVNNDELKDQFVHTIQKRIPHVSEHEISKWVERNLQFFEIQGNDYITIPSYKVIDFICAQID